MIAGSFGFSIQRDEIVDMISPADPGIRHTVFVEVARDGFRRAVWIDPPVPGVGSGHKVFRTARHSLRHAKRLIRRRCIICDAGGSHTHDGTQGQ